jgi:hypothetical protein
VLIKQADHDRPNVDEKLERVWPFLNYCLLFLRQESLTYGRSFPAGGNCSAGTCARPDASGVAGCGGKGRLEGLAGLDAAEDRDSPLRDRVAAQQAAQDVLLGGGGPCQVVQGPALFADQGLGGADLLSVNFGCGQRPRCKASRNPARNRSVRACSAA